MSTLQAALESLRVDLDMILEARVPEYVNPSSEPAKETILASLFSTASMPPLITLTLTCQIRIKAVVSSKEPN